jgi:hypothetical protein
MSKGALQKTKQKSSARTAGISAVFFCPFAKKASKFRGAAF